MTTLAAALESVGLVQVFAGLAYSKCKEFCRQVWEAKAEETRARRVAKILDAIS